MFVAVGCGCCLLLAAARLPTGGVVVVVGHSLFFSFFFKIDRTQSPKATRLRLGQENQRNVSFYAQFEIEGEVKSVTGGAVGMLWPILMKHGDALTVWY